MSSPIFTTTAPVSKVAQSLDFDLTNFSANDGSIYFEMWPAFSSVESGLGSNTVDAGTGTVWQTGITMPTSDSFQLSDGDNRIIVYHQFAIGEKIQFGAYWDSVEGKMQMNINGQWRTPKGDFSGTMDVSQFKLLEGIKSSILIRNLKIWSGA